LSRFGENIVFVIHITKDSFWFSHLPRVKTGKNSIDLSDNDIIALHTAA